MSEAAIVNSWEVKPYGDCSIYESRMILDDILAGEKTVQLNEGTLKAGVRLSGEAHEKSEIYYVVKGSGLLQLGDKIHPVKQGTMVFIPGGVFHALDNTHSHEELIILTIWLNAYDNGVYVERLKEWGTSFKTIYDE